MATGLNYRPIMSRGDIGITSDSIIVDSASLAAEISVLSMGGWTVVGYVETSEPFQYAGLPLVHSLSDMPGSGGISNFDPYAGTDVGQAIESALSQLQPTGVNVQDLQSVAAQELGTAPVETINWGDVYKGFTESQTSLAKTLTPDPLEGIGPRLFGNIGSQLGGQSPINPGMLLATGGSDMADPTQSGLEGLISQFGPTAVQAISDALKGGTSGLTTSSGTAAVVLSERTKLRIQRIVTRYNLTPYEALRIIDRSNSRRRAIRSRGRYRRASAAGYQRAINQVVLRLVGHN